MRRLAGRHGRDESGVVAVVVATCMMLFFGLLAFAIDLGETRVQRSRAQGVADNAALKAAYVYCRDKGTNPAAGETAWRAAAVTAGTAVATSNGLPAAAVVPDGGGWRATVGITVDARFSGAVDVNELGTGATSLAQSDCSSVNPYSLLGLSTTCPNTVRMNGGNNNRIDGRVHSNNDLKFTGSGHLANGGVTSVGVYDVGSGSTIALPAGSGAPVVQDPLGAAGAGERIELWRPGSVRALALGARYHNLGSAIVDDAAVNSGGPGVYYTTNKVNLSNGFVTPAGGVTFIVDSTSSATGFSAGGYTLNHYRDPDNNPNDLLLFTTKPAACGDTGTTLGGGGGMFTGTIYAPYGNVTFNGGNQTGTNGSVIAQVVTFNGSDQKLLNGGGLSTSTPALSLLR